MTEHDWVLYVGASATWDARGRVQETIMTGTPGFVLAHGMPTCEYLQQHGALGATFARRMTGQSGPSTLMLPTAAELAAVPLFASLPEDELQAMARLFAVRGYPAACLSIQGLCRQSDRSDTGSKAGFGADRKTARRISRHGPASRRERPAVPKGRPLAARYARDFVEAAKSGGLVKAALERAELRGVVVAASR